MLRWLTRQWHYSRALARLLNEASRSGDRVRSHQRYEMMRARARAEVQRDIRAP